MGSVRTVGCLVSFEVGVVDRIVHWLPFQRSTSVPAAVPRWSAYDPVAVHFLDEAQEIAVSAILA